MRCEIPEGRASEVIDGRPVFRWILAHCVDTDWPIYAGLPVAPTGHDDDDQESTGAVQLRLFDERTVTE